MKFNRSDFLKTFIISTLAVTAKKIKSEEDPISKISSSGGKEKNSVTIVGGGLSGLYSTYLLDRAGYSTTLIEGNNRFGGRILSHSEDSKFIGELGGEWISHDQKHILRLIKELGLDATPHNIKKESVFVDTDKTVEFSSISRTLLKKILSVHRNMNEKQKQGLDSTDVFNYLKYQGIAQSDLHFLDLKYRAQIGESIRNISANRYLGDLDNFDFRSETFFRIKGGNSGLIEKLQSILQNTKKIMNDPVEEIDQSSNNVRLKTRSGKILDSDLCIVAIPPTMISEIKWTPQLPREKKLSSIQIKSGRATKLLFHIKGNNIGEDEVLYCNSPVHKIYRGGGQEENMNLLHALSVGDSSDFFSEENSETAKDLLMHTMKKYSVEDALEIEKVTLKIWQNEPLIRGAFSIYSPGSNEALLNLGKPFNRVFFAGDYLTQLKSSMNSAVVSAIQAVSRI